MARPTFIGINSEEYFQVLHCYPFNLEDVGKTFRANLADFGC